MIEYIKTCKNLRSTTDVEMPPLVGDEEAELKVMRWSFKTEVHRNFFLQIIVNLQSGELWRLDHCGYLKRINN